MQVHIGIASGQVVASGTGSDGHREYTVTGDSVNLASRLQDRAEPGQTLIAEAVQRAVSNYVDCDALGEVVVKGLDEPVQVWRVEALRGAMEEKLRAAFVGRPTELRQFAAVAETCCETGHGEAIVVRGEAGIGKTRLVEEFTAIAKDRGFVDYKGLFLDFGVGKGQDAIRTIVRRLVRIPMGSGKELRQQIADTAIGEGLLASDQRVFFNDLLDLPQPVEDRAMYDAMDNATRNEGKRGVVAGLIRAVSGRAPILIIVEDAHWADPLMLTHLARMTSTVGDCSALLVMTSRIEGDPLDQAWRSTTGGSPLMTIDLGPLRKDEAIQLAGAFIEASNQFAMDCIERAEGNPLFLEQLLRNAEERGDDEIPASIQSLVLARMDRLSTTDKRALQAASVIGQRFALDALRHVLDDADYACTGLIGHHVVRPEADGFLFAHALIQEGVYGSLLKATLCELHLRAAEWFEDQDPVLHAQHLDRAEHPGASEAYLRAARGQASLHHYERALQLVKQGQEIAQPGDTRFALMSFLGELMLDMGQVHETMKVFKAALEVAESDIERCRALIGLASAMRFTDEFEGALQCLNEAEPLAKAHALDLDLAKLHHLRGNLYFPLGNIDGCHKEHSLSLAHAEKAGSDEWQARAFGGLGDAEYAAGRFISAHKMFSRCQDLCRRYGFGQIEVANINMLGAGGTTHYMNDLKGALQISVSGAEMAEKVGHDRAALLAHMGGAIGYIELSDMESAKQHIERMKALIERIGTRRFMARALQLEARICLTEGNSAEATQLLRSAMEISRESGVGYVGPAILGTLARATDDPDERDAALSEGERLLNEGCVGHNYFEFYMDGIEGALVREDWEAVDRYASALEKYTRAEPLPRTDFFIARGRALAAHGQGDRDDVTIKKLRDLRDEAARVGLNSALPTLDQVLAAT